jgi:apolipoprotein N-acyltransferase
VQSAMAIMHGWIGAHRHDGAAASRCSLHATLAIALSGALVALSAPGVGDWSALAWIAFAPWLASLPRLSVRGAMASGFIMGLAYITPGHWSTFATAVGGTGLKGWERELCTLLFFAIYALPFVVFGLLDRWLRAWAGPSSLQAAALLRAAALASLICLCWSPFPYTPASAIVDAIGIAQWASVGGEPLLLMLLLWPSALVAGFWQASASWTRILRASTLMVSMLLVAAGVGYARIANMDRAEAEGAGLSLSALTLQLDLPTRASPALLMRDRADGGESAIELTRRGYEQAPKCEMAVWPETPIAPHHGARICAAGQSLAAATGKPLLMQCHREVGHQFQLTAEWLAANASARAVHAKSSLVPGYERPILGEGRLRSGTPGTVFALDEHRRLIPTLCYELYSEAHLRRGVMAGGQFIAFMASFNAFDGQPIDRWNQPMARLRAIAYGVPVLRAGNRAPIGWIDAAGRIRHQSASLGQQAECLNLWSPAAQPTLYARIAPIAPWLPVLVLLAVTGLLTVVRRHRGAQAPTPMLTTSTESHP